MQLQSPIFTYHLLFAFLFASFIFFCLLSSVDSCHPNDHTSLLHYNHSLDYVWPPLNWSNAVNCCEWEGISCDQHGRVSHLWLPLRDLGGCIFPPICNLTHLSHLNLSNNYIGYHCDDHNKAILPKDIFTSLSHLEVLDLSDNSFQGEFPSLAKSMSIRILDISYNQFHGEIHVPTQFVAPNLTIFRVDGNNFVGEIPASLCFDSNLHVLDLSSNNFSGMIPHEIAKCSNLRVLNISHHFLSGSLPDHIFNITTLAILDLSYNHLKGSIPRGIGKLAYLKELSLSNNHLALSGSGSVWDYIFNITTLTHIDLSFNNLEGSLSQDIQNLAGLKELDLSGNNLVGTIPSSLMNCTRVSKINLSFNNFSGDISHLKDIRNLARLKELDLSGNNLVGTIPSSLMNCTRVSKINLSFNNFSGDISHLNFSRLTNLKSLDLSYNSFKGEFPHSLYLCKSLAIVELAYNHLLGQILPNITSMTSLEHLSLYNNNISTVTGIIHYIMQCRSLRILDLSSNPLLGANISSTNQRIMLSRSANLQVLGLSGCGLSQIPAWLTKLTKLQVIDLSNNEITGPIPSWLGTLPDLLSIDLSSNQISGYIPPDLFNLPALGSDNEDSFYVSGFEFLFPCFGMPRENSVIDLACQQLSVLNLSNNNLTENIPFSVANVYYLNILDLSFNHLSGRIGYTFNKFVHLKQFNVAYNNLQGPVPGGRLDSFTWSSYQGNPKLCGFPLPSDCPEGENREITQAEDKGKELPWFEIGAAFGFITGFSGVCYSFLFSITWRRLYDQVYVFVAIKVNRFKHK